MIVIVDERHTVVDAYVSLFEREGVAALGLCASDYREWITAIDDTDLAAVEAVLFGSIGGRSTLCRALSTRLKTVIVAICEDRCLEETLDLFAAGVDDVVRKPIHPKEILARINAVVRRGYSKLETKRHDDITVYLDGRDPEVAGETLSLPRRERRILEFLAKNPGSRVTKAQIFSAVYGICNDDFDESVVESHISKLRKRLRKRLGYDPIDSKRFLGYSLLHRDAYRFSGLPSHQSRPAQDHSVLIGRELEHIGD